MSTRLVTVFGEHYPPDSLHGGMNGRRYSERNRKDKEREGVQVHGEIELGLFCQPVGLAQLRHRTRSFVDPDPEKEVGAADIHAISSRERTCNVSSRPEDGGFNCSTTSSRSRP
jgi:hypothetical protein